MKTVYNVKKKSSKTFFQLISSIFRITKSILCNKSQKILKLCLSGAIIGAQGISDLPEQSWNAETTAEN